MTIVQKAPPVAKNKDIIEAKGPASFAEKYIVRSIWEDKFPPGSILPAERELSELIGVTRTTLREVLQRLARDGWLTIQHGKPTKVNDIWESSGLNVLETIADLNPAGEPVLLEQLLSARTNISAIYFKGAVRHNPEKVLEALKEIASLDNDPKAYVEFDYQLHHSLAYHSGNPLYVLILNGFKGLYSRVGEDYFAIDKARELAFEFYKALQQLAQNKNHTAIPALMRNYGINSGKVWQKFKNSQTQKTE